MPTFARLFECYRSRDFARPRQGASRQEGVVDRVEHQRRHADASQPGFARTARPVVVGAGEAVQRGGDDVVELEDRACAAQSLSVEQAGKAFEFGGGVGNQRLQEVPRIDAVEAAREIMAAGDEVERGTDAGGGLENFAGCRFALTKPFKQGIAAERDADGVERPVCVSLPQTNVPSQ